MLPIFLMMMLAQGAYYSALDTVVGERERGTLETLFTSPLAKSEILLGKFLFVTLSALVTFVLNLLSLVFFAGFILQLLDLPVEVRISIPLTTILVLALAALLAGATLAALMMLVVLPAKHYREGQSALMPVYFVAGFSSFAVIGTKMDYSLQYALIPFVNVSALAKTAIGGELSMPFAMASFASLFVLAVVTVFLASKLASRESALFDPDLSLKRLIREAFRS
jgi:sodium transport system permease protein